MDSSDRSPSVQVHTTKPPGVFPKHFQAWVMGGLALAMVIIIAFSSRTPAKRAPQLQPETTAAEPNGPRIDNYRQTLERETARLKEQQARLEQEQAALRPLQDGKVIGPSTVMSPPMPMSLESTERNWMDVDREKRGYQSLYASNVVLSKRRLQDGSQPSEPTAANLKIASGDASATRPIPLGSKTYRVNEGTVIDTVLVNRLDSTFTGPINTLVTTDVYSSDHAKLLIPRGSRVLGSATRVDALNEQRLAVTFKRVILVNGDSVSLESPGLSQAGETGLLDKVDHHYGRIFGISLAIGAIAGLSQSGTDYGPTRSASDAYRQGVSDSLSNASLNILDRFLNIPPTFTVREGTRIKVYLTADLDLPAYTDRRDLPDTRRTP